MMRPPRADETHTVKEPGLWRDNGWTARVIKNMDDDGWAVEMILDGESRTALVGPWTMGRDKKNQAARCQRLQYLVKTASEVLRRHEQHHAQFHKRITVSTEGGPVEVTLDIVADEFEPTPRLAPGRTRRGTRAGAGRGQLQLHPGQRGRLGGGGFRQAALRPWTVFERGPMANSAERSSKGKGPLDAGLCPFGKNGGLGGGSLAIPLSVESDSSANGGGWSLGARQRVAAGCSRWSVGSIRAMKAFYLKTLNQDGSIVRTDRTGIIVPPWNFASCAISLPSPSTAPSRRLPGRCSWHSPRSATSWRSSRPGWARASSTARVGASTHRIRPHLPRPRHRHPAPVEDAKASVRNAATDPSSRSSSAYPQRLQRARLAAAAGGPPATAEGGAGAYRGADRQPGPATAQRPDQPGGAVRRWWPG